MLTLIFSSIVFFAATNIDDIFLLMTWFSQANTTREKRRYIVAGQYLGFILLITLSLIGAFGVLLISMAWIGLLGLVPIYLGIKSLVEQYQERKESISAVKVEGVLHSVGERKPKIDTVENETFNLPGWLKKLLNPDVLKVATVTFVNGGDNIGVYIPFFAAYSTGNIILIVFIFLTLLALWCYAGYVLVRHPLIAQTLERYGHFLVPFVLIGLGIFILFENGTFNHLLLLFN